MLKNMATLGANTLVHIAEECWNGNADKVGVRSGKLHLPNLDRLGLGVVSIESTGFKS